MQFLHRLAKKRKLRTNLLIGALLLVAVFFAGIGESHKTFSSVEVAFTDASHSGLAIVPASCPSNPGDADAPYGCSGSSPLCPNGSAAPNDSVSQCTCAQGNTSACLFCPDGTLAPNQVQSQCTCAHGNTNACARCPNGSLAPNNDANQCTCAQGNVNVCARCANGSLAPNNDVSQCSQCPTGQTLVNGICVSNCPSNQVLSNGVCLSSCPGGQVVVAGICVASCPAGQHAVGQICVCNATNLPSDANGQCTQTVCPTGFQYDPATGQCIAINSCNLPATCSDITHALNQCTGAVTNCASYGAGWVCQNGACIQSPPPIASIITSAKLVQQGTTVTASWSSQNTVSCQVTANNGDGPWNGTTGSHISSPINSQTIFTLVCHGYNGSTIAKTATVNIVPTEVEK